METVEVSPGHSSPSSMIDLCLEEQHGKDFPIQRPTPVNMMHHFSDDNSIGTDKEDAFSPENYFTPKRGNPLAAGDRNTCNDHFSRVSSASNSTTVSRAPSNDSYDAGSMSFPSFSLQPAGMYHPTSATAVHPNHAAPQYQPQAQQQQQHQTPPHQMQKCRQLPCRTFISTGSCPYGDRCVFLHDARITSRPVYVRSKRKTKDDQCVDAFFWPTMPFNAVMGMVDNRNQPHIAQPYVVPVPVGSSTASINGSGSTNNNNNNEVAVYSMWEHFLDFLKADSLSVVTVPRVIPTLDPHAQMNPYTGKARLPVLVHLAGHQHGRGGTESVSSGGVGSSSGSYKVEEDHRHADRDGHCHLQKQPLPQPQYLQHHHQHQPQHHHHHYSPHHHHHHQPQQKPPQQQLYYSKPTEPEMLPMHLPLQQPPVWLP